MNLKILKGLYPSVTTYDPKTITALYENQGRLLSDVQESLPCPLDMEATKSRYFRHTGSQKRKGFTYGLFILKRGFIHVKPNKADVMEWMLNS